jgi:hypothetical protein
MQLCKGGARASMSALIRYEADDESTAVLLRLQQRFRARKARAARRLPASPAAVTGLGYDFTYPAHPGPDIHVPHEMNRTTGEASEALRQPGVQKRI